MKTQTLEEWQKEMKLAFPEGINSVSFECPKCGRVTSLGEFKALGADPDKAPQACIGRFVAGTGCDWAAFGLFLTLGKGRKLMMPDGATIEVFEFGRPFGAVTPEEAADISAANAMGA